LELNSEKYEMSRDEVKNRIALKEMHEQYSFLKNIPPRGLTIKGRPALTQINSKEVGDFVLVTVRDPLINYENDPSAQISGYLENAKLIGNSGMFTSYTGLFEGAKITIVSGGSGSPETELLLYDFMEFSNAHTYIRVGGSGGIGTDVKPGDIVISSGVVREEGMTRAYIDPSFPAVSHYEVVVALAQAADSLGPNFHIGITLSVDSDLVGVGRPGVGGYLQPRNLEVLGTYNRAGVLNGDRESSAVVTLSALYGFRGGSVCSVSDNVLSGEVFQQGPGHSEAIEIALKACVILNEMDLSKKSTRRKYWIPSISK